MGRSQQSSDRLGGPLSLLLLVSYLSGHAHRFLESVWPRYRALNARALERRSTLDRALRILDVLAQVEFLKVGSSTGAGKDLTGVTFRPGLELSDSDMRWHKADLRETVIPGGTFRRMNLRKTIWQEAQLTGCEFKSCSFEQAFLTPRVTKGTSFVDCKFLSARIAGGFDGCAFENSELSEHKLTLCRFRHAAFRSCVLRATDFSGVDLDGAVFEDCDLRDTDFSGASLRGAVFERCDLRGANWSDTDIGGLSIARSAIYGMSLWGTRGEVAVARSLSVARTGNEDELEVDGLHIAVFVVSLLEGNGVRELVDGLSSTLVLVLGRFSQPHKQVLDEIRSKLRDLGYSAIVFDSSAPRLRDTSETVSVLARLSRFVIADLTQPKSAPYELQQFAADGATPLQVVTRGEPPFSMFSDLAKYPWVLPSRQFPGDAELLAALPAMVSDLERLRNDQRGSRETA